MSRRPRVKNTNAIRSILASTALCSCLYLSTSAYRTQTSAGQLFPPPASPLILTCSPDKPTVWTREVITVRGWASRSGEPLRFSWTTTGGRIGSRAAETTWNFAGVSPGTYAATVRVSGGGRVAECTVRVVVQSPSNSRGRESGWSFLISRQTEEAGYGLYTYLLLGSPPAERNRERYRRAIEAWVGLIPDITALEQYITRRELNVTYLPLALSPPAGPIAVDWALQHYDYARARALLSKLPGDYRDGPYLISSLAPMTAMTTSPPRFLFQDLSRTPAHLVTLWVKEFFNQAAQERFWEETTARGLALKLRTTIAILAISLPDVPKTLEDAIVWKR